MGEPFIREVRKRRATPHRKSFPNYPGAISRLAFFRLRHEPLEPKRIESRVVHFQNVSRRLSSNDFRAERLSELRNVVLQRRQRRSRGLLAPKLVDKTVCRHQLTGVNKEQRQKGALLLAAEPDQLPVALDLERAKDAELEHGPLFLARTKRLA